MSDGGKQVPPNRSTASPADAPALDAKFARRRRLLKVGAAGVPVALTLTSRPVLAWRCNTTSAWGSAQMMPNQSTTARNSAHQLADDSWTIDNWLQNTRGVMGTHPWVTLGTQSSSYGVSDVSKNYKISKLFTAGAYPSGLSGSDKVWKKIESGTTFQKYMIVAQLNAKLIPNVASCLKSNGTDQLKEMLDGNYTPPNAGAPSWNSAQIQNYLYNNYIVR